MSSYTIHHKYGSRNAWTKTDGELKYCNSLGVLNKTIIPLALVGYEIVIAISALRASLAIYYLISNARSWNNFKYKIGYIQDFFLRYDGETFVKEVDVNYVIWEQHGRKGYKYSATMKEVSQVRITEL